MKKANMENHTPIPWECGEAKNYHGYYIAPKGKLPTLAAVERVGTEQLHITVFNFPGETKANAEFIVRAVNNHDKLIAALQAQIKYWEQVPSGVDYDADPNNSSPEDMTAHLAGLAIKDAFFAIKIIEES
jgi:hypothetical protein